MPFPDYEAHCENLADLCQQLGAYFTPKYSLFKAGPVSDQERDLISLVLMSGVRVFLVTPEPLDPGWLAEVSDHHLTRLLEYEVVDEANVNMPNFWCADGRLDPASERMLELADTQARGGINTRQYKIVHAPIDVDLEVQAGAGTGKTETMIERCIFLLSCHDVSPYQLGMVTFTKEAAKQMRSRLIKSLTTRQRLCNSPVHPYQAWMSEVAEMPIKTIHALSRLLVTELGANLGVTHQLKVGNLTLERTDVIREVLSEQLAQLPDELRRTPFHEWERDLKKAIEALGKAAVSTLSDEPLDWGQALNPSSQAKQQVLSQVIPLIYTRLRALQMQRQTFHTDELTPLALKSLRETQQLGDQALRFLFIDEFQDTDPLQMELFQAYCARSACKLFYVGDKKQAIYRFRGADGDAFTAMRHLQQARNAGTQTYTLTRNFRTGERLLQSFHQHFSRWGGPPISRLSYQPAQDQLWAAPFAQGAGDQSTPLHIAFIEPRSELQRLQEDIQQLINNHDDEAPLEVAILVRTNNDAYEAQQALREINVPCDLMTGGDFYQSLPVRELLALLNAVANPNDKVALLNLLDTSWAPALLHDVELQPLLSWSERLRRVEAHQAAYQDLQPLVEVLSQLQRRARLAPLPAFLNDCIDVYQPSLYVSHDQADGVRRADAQAYERGLNFLITRLIEALGDASMSLMGLVDWLTIKVTHDENTDLPAPEGASAASVIAVTVHRAKGQEYEVVIIPRTSRPFLSHRSAFKLIADRGAVTRIHWREGAGRHRQGNQHLIGAQPWNEQDLQTCLEETRLLYVAMTRAKRRLDVYVERDADDDTWGALLKVNPPAPRQRRLRR